MINTDRLRQVFENLVKIDSPSGEEKKVAEWLKTKLAGFECKIVEDDAAKKLNTEAGNIIAYFDGNNDKAPIMLGAHMDTVEPGRGIEPVFENGIFTSKGNTVLGGDDKSAIAVILEVLEVLKENNIDHCPIDIVFTVFEEGGLRGAKAIDPSLIRAKFGYIPDSGDVEGIVMNAPGCNELEFTIKGKASHAGAEPEKGVNAIMTAAKALSKIDSGRIDAETTCNIGIINGGKATNIVPDSVTIKAEVRSHDLTKLEDVTNKIKKAFEDAVEEDRKKYNIDNFPKLELKIDQDFPNLVLKEDDMVVCLGKEAASKVGFELKGKVSGGGSDANILFHKGIKAAVIGTGMTEIHTVNESIALKDMVKCAEFLLEIIKTHSK